MHEASVVGIAGEGEAAGAAAAAGAGEGGGAAVGAEADKARTAGPAWLAQALQDTRRDTLATFEVYERGLATLGVPQRSGLNPPAWELGHIGWFQEFWIGRNPARRLGVRADPTLPRGRPLRPDADALYDSSRVAHATRWRLPLPDADATRDDLRRQLDGSIALLDASTDDALYFHRLALLHEDMHHEAALYMAQSLGLAIDDPRWQARPLPAPGAAVTFEAGGWTLGSTTDAGFAFDNELPAHPVTLGRTDIDAQVVRWSEFLPFVDAGGYADDRWWTAGGAAWRATQQATTPRDLRRADSGWEHRRHGRWRPLDASEAAVHLTRHEAEAWCAWAGRRLPTEAEWERAAMSRPDAFRWGDVWEWTASAFAPFAGFEPHPYRDYSAPWFDGRPALRGASFMTQPRLRHPRYRNFFPADRNDVPAGFRSCAV